MGAPTMRFPSVPVNPTAFHVIDTAEKAYLIGFLLADGCIREPVAARNRYRVNLRILAQDIKVCQMVQRIAGGHLRLIEDGYPAMGPHPDPPPRRGAGGDHRW